MISQLQKMFSEHKVIFSIIGAVIALPFAIWRLYIFAEYLKMPAWAWPLGLLLIVSVVLSVIVVLEIARIRAKLSAPSATEPTEMQLSNNQRQVRRDELRRHMKGLPEGCKRAMASMMFAGVTECRSDHFDGNAEKLRQQGILKCVDEHYNRENLFMVPEYHELLRLEWREMFPDELKVLTKSKSEDPEK